MKQVKQVKIDVKTYANSCQFLQAYYQLRKKQDPDFSYDTWSQELTGVNRSYLRLVVMGKRPLSETLKNSLISNCGFDLASAQYFNALVGWGQSRTAEERKLWADRILSLQGPRSEIIEAQAHFDFLSEPDLPALHTVLGFKDAPTDQKILAEVFGLSVDDIKSKLAKLESLQLAQGPLQTNRSWKVPENLGALGHGAFYNESFRKSAEAMSLPKHLRRFRSLFLAMDDSEFSDFLHDFELFVNQQLRKRDAPTIRQRRLFNLGFSFFAVTEEVPSSNNDVADASIEGPSPL